MTSRIVPALACFFLAGPAVAQPRTAESRNLDVIRAHSLVVEGKANEAVALLAPLLEEEPRNADLHFRMAYALYVLAQPNNEPENVALRKRSHRHFAHAQEHGLKDPIIVRALQEFKEDGLVRETRFSPDHAANAAMQAGDAASRKRDFATARKHYEEALKLDATLYTAALFAGNTYYSEGNLPEAEKLFARAVEIDPDCETAHRYWADALYQRGKTTEALGRYVQAFVAEPYSGVAWRSLQERATALGRLRPLPPQNLPRSTVSVEATKTSITLDPEKMDALTIIYSIARSKWATENKDSSFLPSAVYRHSLAEESYALSTLLEIAGELRAPARDSGAGMRSKLETMEPALSKLAEAEKLGLLEPYVLFMRANDDIAKDYPEYRAKHRDKLVQYVQTFMVNLD